MTCADMVVSTMVWLYVAFKMWFPFTHAVKTRFAL